MKQHSALETPMGRGRPRFVCVCVYRYTYACLLECTSALPTQSMLLGEQVLEFLRGGEKEATARPPKLFIEDTKPGHAFSLLPPF